MAKAVNPFGPDAQAPRHDGFENPEDKTAPPDWKAKRERAVWYAVAGIGLMFAGSISTALGIGGAFMAIWGIAEYIRWTIKRPKDDDPWRDEELDRWESEHYGKEVDGPDVVDEEPESALGLHDRW